MEGIRQKTLHNVDFVIYLFFNNIYFDAIHKLMSLRACGEKQLVHINQEFYYGKHQPDRSVSDMDRLISGYIGSMGEDGCSQALEFDFRDEVRYHLGRERQSALSWYPFKENAVILEVGAGFGAMTGALCERAKYVVVTEPSLFRAAAIRDRYSARDNLEIYVGNAPEMQFSIPFDYIIILDAVNKIGNQAVMDTPYIRALGHLGKFLKPDGKFLLTTDNLYSLTNCQNGGALNPWNHNRLLHKAQISKILEKSGFPFYQFYYPLPDSHMVGRVYSDRALPTAVEWNCLSNPNCEDQNFLSNNMDLITKLTDNGMFTNMAPSFFIEAERTDDLSSISKASVLIGESVELPIMGFDWGIHGKKLLPDAARDAAEKDGKYFQDRERFRASILKIDQDHEEMEKVVEVELDLLRRLHEVCEKHGLKLFLMYGTLLGAVRNGGMIQGDDDVDVAMTRADFDRLVSLQEEFEDPYFLQTPANDECFFGGYLKLRNRNTTAIHPQNWWVDCCEGISIDIFPIDGGYTDAEREERKQKEVRILQRLLYAKAYGYFPCFRDMKLLKWKAYKYIGKLFSREQLAERLSKVMAGTDGSKTAPFGIYAHYLPDGGTPRWLERKAFDKVVEMPYEGMRLKAPFDWDRILKMLYGEQYMEPNAWSEWKMRHGFYNASESYLVYKRRYAGLFRPEPEAGRRIVLFGDGYLFGAYFRRYGKDHRPAEIVLVREDKTLDCIGGIRVKSLQEFSFENKELIYPVICSADIRGTEKTLKEIGLVDYYIFAYNRDWIRRANWTSVANEASVIN